MTINGDRGYVLVMLYGAVVLNITFSMMSSPFNLIPAGAVLGLFMWLYKHKSDDYVDWHGREFVRLNILMFIYLVVGSGILGFFIGAAMSGDPYAAARTFNVAYAFFFLAIVAWALINIVRHIIAAHKERPFVYPFTFSPRRSKRVAAQTTTVD